MPKRWLTTKQAADFLGVHPNTVRNWADAGVLTVRRTSGKQRRFDPDELKQHVLAARAGASSETTTLVRRERRRRRHREDYLRALAEAAGIASARAATPSTSSWRVSRPRPSAHRPPISSLPREAGAARVPRGLAGPGAASRRLGDRCALDVDEYSDWAAVAAGSDGEIVDTHDPSLAERERDAYEEWLETSVMSVPMRFRGELIGLLDITTREIGRVFDEDDLSFTQVVATHLATALTNARLLAAERAHTAQMEALLAISAAVNSTVGLPQSLDTMCREMGAGAGGRRRELLHARQPHRRARARGTLGAGPAEDLEADSLGERYALDRLPSWTQAIASGMPVVAEPAAVRVGDDDRDGAEVSWITVPLYDDGQSRRARRRVLARPRPRLFDDMSSSPGPWRARSR